MEIQTHDGFVNLGADLNDGEGNWQIVPDRNKSRPYVEKADKLGAVNDLTDLDNAAYKDEGVELGSNRSRYYVEKAVTYNKLGSKNNLTDLDNTAYKGRGVELDSNMSRHEDVGYNKVSDSITITKRKFSEKTKEKEIEIDIKNLRRLNYRTAENPSILLTLLFSMQNVMLALPWCLSMAILVAEFACGEHDYNMKAMLLSTTLVMSGLTTIVQVTLGIRLPVYQGPTTAYIIPLIALKDSPEWSCPATTSVVDIYNTSIISNMTLVNGTESMVDFRTRVILPKIRLTMGSLALAGFIHMLTGMFGLVGFLMKFVGPITVIPTVLLIGLNTFKVTTKFCQVHWGIASITCVSSLILSLYMDGRQIPIPVWTPKRKWHVIRYPLLQVLSILISIIIGWCLSVIFTVTNVIPDDKNSPQYKARTDAETDVVETTPWFYFPYPGQFGNINFSSGLFMAFITATLYSITDSIADYHACAKMARVPPPPIHAINRGIMVEGCLTMISGFFRAGHATSTYGGHIGSIGITKVASRIVFIVFPSFLVLFGIIVKLAAVFISIPYPVLGGVQVIGFGMFIGLVMSNLQYIDIQSTRNLAIIGISTLLGLMLPYWSSLHSSTINTGFKNFDSFIRVLLSNPSLVGGFTACFLDNTVSGTAEIRGLLAWGQLEESATKLLSSDYEEGFEVYEILSWSERTKKISFTKFIPFFPNYKAENISCGRKKTKFEINNLN